MKKPHKKPPEEVWEKGELGATKTYAKKVSKKREMQIDDDLDLQLISLRLQKSLIDDLKRLASDVGLGYQPYIRQLLTQHVSGKKKREGTYG
jgi:predicted DNA binding CopG/RHH family protein